MRSDHTIVAIACAHALIATVALGGVDYVGLAPVRLRAEPGRVLSGDLNGDGRTDLVVVHPAIGELSVYLADYSAASHFDPARAIRFGQALGGAALGDVNGDRRLDIVVTDPQVVWIVLGEGDGTFRAPFQVREEGHYTWTAVALGNFDQSGHVDLALADPRLGRVFLLLNDDDPHPGFRAGGELYVGEHPIDVRSVDLDGDGRLDLLTLNTDGPRVQEIATALWTGVAAGIPQFDSVQRVHVGERPGQLVIGDFNADSRPDIALLNHALGANASDEIEVLLNHGCAITLDPPIAIPLPCPFFTGGAPCPALALAASDADRNGTIDLIVALDDPRLIGGSVERRTDAFQVHSGAGDGRFIPATVLATRKGPAYIATVDLNRDRREDIAVVSTGSRHLQAFLNVSRPGAILTGAPCVVDDECLSSHCIDGVCCADPCGPGEHCALPGREGICVPPTPIACRADEPDCPDGMPCFDGFCCDLPCEGGQCDAPGFEGICIPTAPWEESCSEDAACQSGWCARNHVCCATPCDDGFCDDDGTCHPRLDNGSPCVTDDACLSNVCDEHDLICCNRRCDGTGERCSVEEGPSKGRCLPLDLMPAIGPTPSRAWLDAATATMRPTATPRVPCAGDCNGNCTLVIDELILGVKIALGLEPAAACRAFDPDGSDTVTIEELMQGIDNALGGCPRS